MCLRPITGEQEPRLIPRKLWILWFQGLDNAPFLVRKCIDSWLELNVGWEIVILTDENLSDYIVPDLPAEVYRELPATKQSNLIRLQLLAKYGGVWADATTMCMAPLDEWIDDYASSGFFAFNRPGVDRVMANWFIASIQNGPIVSKLREIYRSFYTDNSFDIVSKRQRRIIQRLESILNRSEKTTRFWLSPIVTKIFKVYPFYIFHYMFERLVARDSECKTIWKNTQKVSADLPHKIQVVGLFSPLSEALKAEIDAKQVPVYKLTWKYDHSQYCDSSLLYYLLEGRHRS